VQAPQFGCLRGIEELLGIVLDGCDADGQRDEILDGDDAAGGRCRDEGDGVEVEAVGRRRRTFSRRARSAWSTPPPSPYRM